MEIAFNWVEGVIMWPFDDVLAAVNALFDFFLGLVYIVLYPFIALLSLIVAIIVWQINILIDFINIPIRFADLIQLTISSVIDAISFDSAMGWGFAAAVSIVIALKLWKIFQGIEIGGNKL